LLEKLIVHSCFAVLPHELDLDSFVWSVLLCVCRSWNLMWLHTHCRRLLHGSVEEQESIQPSTGELIEHVRSLGLGDRDGRSACRNPIWTGRLCVKGTEPDGAPALRWVNLCYLNNHTPLTSANSLTRTPYRKAMTTTCQVRQH
jgi:hypothetical protein